MAMDSSKSIKFRFEEAQSYALVQLGMPHRWNRNRQFTLFIDTGSNVVVRCLLNWGRVYLSKRLTFVFDFKQVC